MKRLAVLAAALALAGCAHRQQQAPAVPDAWLVPVDKPVEPKGSIRTQADAAAAYARLEQAFDVCVDNTVQVRRALRPGEAHHQGELT